MFLICISTLLTLFICYYFSKGKARKSIKNKHVVITGGSSGIGKSIAKLCVEMGADVTIIARKPEKLQKALVQIERLRINSIQKINAVSVNTCDYVRVSEEFEKMEKHVGPIYMLVNCVGLAICGKFEKLSDEQIRYQMDVNFLGVVYPIRAIITRFKRRRAGIFVMTASQGALMGIFGMSIYNGSKFALRGFAEALDMEVKPYNISVTVALPPDTDTPGFETENKGKPEETRLICESGGLYSPDEVAKTILNDSLNGNFFSYVGLESFLMTTLCAGMSPFSSIFQLIYQSILIGPIRLISAFYLCKFHSIVKKLAK